LTRSYLSKEVQVALQKLGHCWYKTTKYTLNFSLENIKVNRKAQVALRNVINNVNVQEWMY